MPGITSYMHAYNYALNHPVFLKLDSDSLKEHIKLYDHMAEKGSENAAGVADAIRVILINRSKGVAANACPKAKANPV